MKTVYYFGDKYYDRSKTMMGVLYTEDNQRYDWGFLQRDVRNGVDVVVKKATPAMLRAADEQLEKLIKQYK